MSSGDDQVSCWRYAAKFAQGQQWRVPFIISRKTLCESRELRSQYRDRQRARLTGRTSVIALVHDIINLGKLTLFDEGTGKVLGLAKVMVMHIHNRDEV